MIVLKKGPYRSWILARYGFIASSMLRGFVQKGIMTEEQKDRFLNSIETVAGTLVDDMDRVLAGDYSLQDFLSKYGTCAGL
ncbi:MAG: hypothetical protein U5J95_12780 [Balneolaceae bacterium]|nr:hypothetical protein [Balneolaceae bacterium]